MTDPTLSQRIKDVTGAKIIAESYLSGGGVATVTRVDLDNGQSLVIKVGVGANLDIEAAMLRYLTDHSPIRSPNVLYDDSTCLVMGFIANDGQMSGSVQRDLAKQLAKQHAVTSDQYGLSFDTLIGGLHQPNTQSKSWITFFGEHRLRYMATAAHQEGILPTRLVNRIDKLIVKLGDLIADKPAASLLHGDLWGGNILCQDDKIAGLIDPAIYYGDREIELAFGTLFGDLTPEFFKQYDEVSKIEPGFFEERRDLYNLYPLLVHVRLFGGSYVGSVDQILSRFGV
ncbi:fructosamine kinase family protein [Thalassospira lucentensis]|uniref:Fructosamine kinase n=1 Tax=Thalassospira lucentensis TaxID=168935 RepID=A0A358HU83_9PROT|nr:fructosamine kinase family protein [Thalassospira lucentensis]HBU98743.1 fructosamine kinase [Thalassospira lucentensis]HCW69346.1 fructosamine kinase [Thalassospira lucentensis]